MKYALAPGLAARPTAPRDAPPVARGHAKVVRFFRKLTDDQVLALVAALDATLARSGMAPGPLRQALMRFASEAP